MLVSEQFPTKYLSAADLQGRAVKLVIESIAVETIGTRGDRKPVVYFRGATKGLVANKTNSNTIAQYYGDDTDGWIGKPIELFSMSVDFQGKTVEAIRVRVPRPAIKPLDLSRSEPRREGAAPARAVLPTADDVLDDEIPF